MKKVAKSAKKYDVPSVILKLPKAALNHILDIKITHQFIFIVSPIYSHI